MLDALFTSDSVLAATAPRAWVDALVRFEVELARAQEALGILGPGSADAVAGAAGRAQLTPLQLAVDGRSSGNPVVPLVRAIAAAGHDVPVHLGATSQDAMDTAAMLVAGTVCTVVLGDLDHAAGACAALVEVHRRSAMTGRTLLQPAVPVTFGLKAAGWLVALIEARDALARVATERLAVQLGGAAGTMASFGDRGPELCAALAGRLGLRDPLLPWHTDRSRIVELGAALVVTANACAKIALDVVLLSQAEVGEVAEGGEVGEGDRGGSSTMPHKANAIGAVSILAAARHAHGAFATLVAAGVQDHERAATGGWHAEWDALCRMFQATGGCASNAAALLTGLRVDATRMADNLAATHGLVVAERIALDLAPDSGRAEAAALVRKASTQARREGRSLRDVLGAMPEVTALRTPAQLDALCDPWRYLGAADQLVDRALDLHASRRSTDRTGGGT